MLEPFVLEREQTLTLPSWKSLQQNLVVGFTTKNGGVSEGHFSTLNTGLHVLDRIDSVCKNKEILSGLLGMPSESWVGCEQTHEDNIVKIDKSHKGRGVYSYDTALEGTDGMYTDKTDILLTLCFADCVPLYFYAPDYSVIGIAHAGWKGTVSNIAGKMIRRWEEEGIHARDIHVAIGPSISSKAYVVDNYVVDKVKAVIPISKHEAVLSEISPGQYELDLKQLNLELLLEAGVEKRNISCSSYCTSSDDSLFFSHRRDEGKTGRMMSFIGLKGVEKNEQPSFG